MPEPSDQQAIIGNTPGDHTAFILDGIGPGAMGETDEVEIPLPRARRSQTSQVSQTVVTKSVVQRSAGVPRPAQGPRSNQLRESYRENYSNDSDYDDAVDQQLEFALAKEKQKHRTDPAKTDKSFFSNLQRFWNWIDDRDIDKHAVSVAIMWGTVTVIKWAMGYAELHHDKAGIEIAAIIAAVSAPYMALQGVAIKFYFDART